MYYRRRIRLVVLGMLGSMLSAWVLVVNCMGISQDPAEQKALPFPYAVPDTPLVLLGVVGYEGAYVEGGDEEVVDVAALLVKNNSSQPIRQAQIRVACAQQTMQFDLTYLPPGKSLMVLESSGELWIPQEVYTCSAEYAFGQVGASSVAVRETGDGVLSISNLTDHTLYHIRIYHKNWSKEAGMYLGGITYETCIDSLQPGQLILLRPDHFAPGISHIICITTQ